MKIKRYFAGSMRDAMRLVREEQGPDAVILGTQPRDGGIEVVAAVDYDEALLQQAVRRSTEPSAAAATAAEATPKGGRDAPREGKGWAGTRPPPQPQRPPASAQLIWAQDPHLRRLQEELQGMRRMLSDTLTRQADQELRQHPERARALRALTELGLDPQLAREIAAALPDTLSREKARSLPLGLLARRIPVLSDARLMRMSRLVLVGPTGAGKTTTLAKLAARAVQEHGARNVALITLDDQRAGAEAQLAVYARLLGIPLRVAQGVDGLRRDLAACEDCARVFIDTAGLGPADKRLAALLPDIARIEGLHAMLALPANLQQEDLLATMARFRAVRPQGVVLTKIDECSRLGPAISALVGSRMPLAWLSDGQAVPQDLHRASAADLVTRCVRLAQRQRSVSEARNRPTTHEKERVHG